MPAFRSAEELREVVDRLLARVSDDPDVGPRLRDADVPERFEFPDFGLVVHVRPGRDGEGCLVWAWGEDVGWEDRVCLTMTSDVANRYFQGQENIPVAVARRRIKAQGDLKAAFAVIPIHKDAFPHYRELVATEYPHLAV